MDDILKFLAEHADIFSLVWDAITNRGVDRAKLVAAIKREMVEASNGAMHAALDAP